MSSEVGFAVVCEDRVSVSCVRLPPGVFEPVGWLAVGDSPPRVSEITQPHIHIHIYSCVLEITQCRSPIVASVVLTFTSC